MWTGVNSLSLSVVFAYLDGKLKLCQLNRVAGPQCPIQTSSRNIFIQFWVGLIRACRIWSNIVHLRMGRASPINNLMLPVQIITHCFKYYSCNYWQEQLFVAFLVYIIFILTLLQPCVRDGIMWDPGSCHTF